MVKVKSRTKKGGLAVQQDRLGGQSAVHVAAGKWRSRKFGEPNEEEVSKPSEEDPVRQYSIDKDFLQNIKYGHDAHRDSKKTKSQPITKSFCVKKHKPKENMKTVLVLKPADKDSRIISTDNCMNYAGPRFTDDGMFISHSLLGSLQDFKTEAKRRGEFRHLLNKNMSAIEISKTKMGPKQCKPLKMWKTRIDEWEQAQNYLSGKLKRPVEDLLMRTPNVYPAWVDNRRETTQAVDATFSGYGEKRENSTFWKHTVKYGHDDRTAIFSTLRKSETGDCQPVEFRQVPDSVKYEIGKGEIIPDRSYKAHYTDFLEEQRENVKDMIHILNPHHPDLADLMVEGKGQGHATPAPSCGVKTNQGQITIHAPVFCQIFEDPEEKSRYDQQLNAFKGPALSVANQVITWQNITGSKTLRPLSLTFNTEPGQKEIKHISLENCGSTLIHYDWERVPVSNPFDIIRPRLQQFYFFSEGGILPPGGELQLPVLYKSDFPGNFKQTWKLTTRPILSGGSEILISFRARTSAQLIHCDKIGEIEKQMFNQQKQDEVSAAMEELLMRVMTPVRTGSPIVSYLSDDERFNLEYPGLIYHSSKLKQLEELYSTVCNSDLIKPQPTETFTVQNLRKVISSLDFMELPVVGSDHYKEILEEKDYKRRLYTHKYCKLTTEMSFPQPSPSISLNVQHQCLCKHVLHMTIEDFTESAYTMAYKLNIPVKVVELEENNEDKQGDKKKKKSMLLPKQKKGVKETEQKSKNSISPTQIKQLSASPSRNRRIGTNSPQKDPTPPLLSPLLSTNIESFSPVMKEVASENQQEMYKAKLYTMAYTMLQDAVDKIENIFIGLGDGEGKSMGTL